MWSGDPFGWYSDPSMQDLSHPDPSPRPSSHHVSPAFLPQIASPPDHQAASYGYASQLRDDTSSSSIVTWPSSHLSTQNNPAPLPSHRTDHSVPFDNYVLDFTSLHQAGGEDRITDLNAVTSSSLIEAQLLPQHAPNQLVPFEGFLLDFSSLDPPYREALEHTWNRVDPGLQIDPWAYHGAAMLDQAAGTSSLTTTQSKASESRKRLKLRSLLRIPKEPHGYYERNEILDRNFQEWRDRINKAYFSNTLVWDDTELHDEIRKVRLYTANHSVRLLPPVPKSLLGLEEDMPGVYVTVQTNRHVPKGPAYGQVLGFWSVPEPTFRPQGTRRHRSNFFGYASIPEEHQLFAEAHLSELLHKIKV